MLNLASSGNDFCGIHEKLLTIFGTNVIWGTVPYMPKSGICIPPVPSTNDAYADMKHCMRCEATSLLAVVCNHCDVLHMGDYHYKGLLQVFSSTLCKSNKKHCRQWPKPALPCHCVFKLTFPIISLTSLNFSDFALLYS